MLHFWIPMGEVLYTLGEFDKALIFLEKAAGLKEDENDH